MINLQYFLVLGAVVFCIGLFGALSKRNAVAILMSIEIMLNAVNISLVAYASTFQSYAGAGHGERLTGQIFAIFIITVAAAEAAVALAMIIAIYRRRSTIDVGQINLMRW